MRSVFILIDALGWQKVREMEFLPEFSGNRFALKTILGYSGACQAAIFTGKPPSETGHWLMYSFARRTTTFGAARWLRPLPKWVKNRGRCRRWLRRRADRNIRGYFSLYSVPVEALPYLDVPAKEDLYSPGGLAPARGILDDLADRRTPFSVWSWRVGEEESLEDLIAQLQRDEKRFYLVYWTKLDALMHEYGTGAPEVERHVRWYESAIRRVAEVGSQRGGETRIFVFSDHGMIDTTGTTDLMGPVAALGLRYGKDYVAFFDSTLARFSFFSDRARRSVETLLSEQPGGEILSPEAMKALGVYDPEGRYGDLVFLTQPGVIIEPSYMGTRAPRAMHGFHPDAAGSDAHFISNVETGQRMESVMDVYSAMRGEMSG